MRNILLPASPDAPAPTRVAWLPGVYNGAQDFLTAGFAHAVGRRQIALDLEFVDLEMTHWGDRTALQQLRSDIVLPARAAGTAIWLGGISLGGFFALDYAACYPGELDGLCLLAPYLGNRMLIAEIAAAGGIADWQPGALAVTDEERRVWRYIKFSSGMAPLYLGFGLDDRFAAAHESLAAALPPDSVHRIAGGHEWHTWTRLWENFLDWRFT